MLSYIIRLDDACPTMNAPNWERVEEILDAYAIKPIVGLIPDSKDSKFCWEIDTSFWGKTAVRYRDKGWLIAQHGCYHQYQNDTKSEFVGLSYNEQKALIAKGYDILCSHSVKPTCFFAPAHSYDDVTIDVCRDLGCFDFMSDGQALYQYRYRGMLFIPAFFGIPHAFGPIGIYTFVLHPNVMKENDFETLELFCKRYKNRFINVTSLLSQIDSYRHIGVIDKLIVHSLQAFRAFRSRR